MKTAALAGAAGAVSGALPLPVRALTKTGFGPATRVAIVGGGIAGPNAAYLLTKAGISATVYEARRRVGGRILSVTPRSVTSPSPIAPVRARAIHSQLLSHLEWEGARAYAARKRDGTSASCFAVIEPFMSNKGITSRRTRTAVAAKAALPSLFTESGATRSPRTLPTLIYF